VKNTLLFVLGCVLSQVGFAQSCGKLTDYDVPTITFAKLSLAEGLGRILAGTPFQLVIESDNTARVSAVSVSGPLSSVLEGLSRHARFTYRQDRCTVVVAGLKSDSTVNVIDSKVLAAKTFQLTGGTPVHTQLAAWAKEAGWDFHWGPQKSWMVPADMSFDGTIDQAVSKVISLLHAQGKPVRLMVWEGNRFLEVVDVDAK
jgi:hypothetical protein